MHNPRSHVFDSNGPNVRIRGSALQIYEKYMLLARDSQRTDRIAAENLAQHAEHYYRLANANNALSNGADRRGPQGQPNGAAQDGNEDDGQQSQSREDNSQSPEAASQEAVAEIVPPPPSSQAEPETAESQPQAAPEESKPRRRSSGRPRRSEPNAEPTSDTEPVEA